MSTRYGPNSSNTLDIALINNFNFPYDITSISDLSSDHNLVLLNFSLCNITHMDKPRAISTCWSAFHNNLDNNIHFADILNIKNPHTLEDKITQFTDAVRSTHSQASKPITNKVHSYTPQHIRNLITLKNRVRKLYLNTLNPIYRTEANRLQAHIKKQIKIHTQQVWNNRLKALNTQDNSIWQIQKHFRKSKSNIPPLIHASGIATSDDQKANALANIVLKLITQKTKDQIISQTTSTPTSQRLSKTSLLTLPLLHSLLLTLTSLSKIAEHIILIRINQFINDTNFLNPNKYGFTKQLFTYPPTAQTHGKNLGWIPERQIHWSCFSGHPKGF
ncbi:RNA-directed DNA polymerase from mobile element jockey [Trichonephila clavipes]|nr:RNA-directed DNA polymerase from mobile element jockey [Trichonephila clavipes]